jgi:1-acyl-sn-glycerol-3-phosphate acyltransferase
MSLATVLRSLLYYVLIALMTIPLASWTLLHFWCEHDTRRRAGEPWVKCANWLIKHVLGITYEVRGLENLPAQPCVVLSKHQSAWETIALQEVFPRTVFVWKKELQRIPFFGWALAVTPMIAIDRMAGAGAMRDLVEQGKTRLAQGYTVVIFPEGTRATPGTQRSYKPGGALVATSAKVPVLPVALNSGDSWGRRAIFKQSGHIIVSIGPAIPSAGLKAAALTAKAEAWIEAEMRRISPHQYQDHVATPITADAAD